MVEYLQLTKPVAFSFRLEKWYHISWISKLNGPDHCIGRC